jgi:hypothetical protein
MQPRDDERVTGVKLPTVHERHGQIVFPDNAGWLNAAHDLAKDAAFTHELLPQI